MFIKKYWTSIKENIHIDGKTTLVTCYGGSNISMNDAEEQARKKILLIMNIIKDNSRSTEDYTVEIREEICDEINNMNIITRNRYGALVLNSENLPIIDIDQPKRSLIGWLFGPKDIVSNKQMIISQVKNIAAKPEFARIGFRIYETNRGVRVILEGTLLKPESTEMMRVFKLLNSDPLYARLCAKQKCFRARLTPKPKNIGLRFKKIVFPRTNDEQSRVDKWLLDYESKALNFASCRLVETIRSPSSNLIISYHDEKTKAKSKLPLG